MELILIGTLWGGGMRVAHLHHKKMGLSTAWALANALAWPALLGAKLAKISLDPDAPSITMSLPSKGQR